MKKGILRPLLLLLGFFLALLGLFIASPIYAQSYVEDFEDFDVGSVAGQDGWISVYGEPAYISTSTPHSGNLSLHFNSGLWEAKLINLEPRSTGWLEFWFYSPVVSGDTPIYVKPNTDSWDYPGELEFMFFQSNFYVRISQYNWAILASGISNSEWHKIKIEWSVATQLVRARVDGGDWSDWVLDWQYIPFSSINRIFWYSGRWTIAEFFIDDIKYGEEWATMPELVPIYPEAGTTTQIAVGTFNATGYWWWDELDPINWHDLEVRATKGTTTQRFFYDIYQINSGTYTIPVVLIEEGYWEIEYVFWGTEIIIDYGYRLVQHTPEIAETWLVVGSPGLPEWVEIPYIEYYEEEEPEPGTIQHFLWSIKKFFRDLFIPTVEGQGLFLQKVRTIDSKFPYNYISEVKSFLSSTQGQITQDPIIEFTLFNATGTVTTSIFATDITVGSQTKTFADWFQIIFKIMILGGFVTYTINFIRRIF